MSLTWFKIRRSSVDDLQLAGIRRNILRGQTGTYRYDSEDRVWLREVGEVGLWRDQWIAHVLPDAVTDHLDEVVHGRAIDGWRDPRKFKREVGRPSKLQGSSWWRSTVLYPVPEQFLPWLAAAQASDRHGELQRWRRATIMEAHGSSVSNETVRPDSISGVNGSRTSSMA